MMEEQKMPQGKMCNCGCCSGMGMGGGWALRLLRWIFAIVILIIVFSFGVRLGELKIQLGYSAGYRMMGAYARMHPMMMQGMSSSTMPGM